MNLMKNVGFLRQSDFGCGNCSDDCYSLYRPYSNFLKYGQFVLYMSLLLGILKHEF